MAKTIQNNNKQTSGEQFKKLQQQYGNALDFVLGKAFHWASREFPEDVF